MEKLTNLSQNDLRIRTFSIVAGMVIAFICALVSFRNIYPAESANQEAVRQSTIPANTITAALLAQRTYSVLSDVTGFAVAD